MAFGLLIDIPLFVAPLVLMWYYRKQISTFLLKIKMPNFLLFVLTSVPLIIYEENINCGAFACAIPNLFPFTMYFLVPFVIVLGLLVKLFHAKRIYWSAVIFSIIGVVNELAQRGGVSSAEFRALQPAWLIFLLPWIFISYAFLVIVPLTILLKDTKKLHKKKKTLAINRKAHRKMKVVVY